MLGQTYTKAAIQEVNEDFRVNLGPSSIHQMELETVYPKLPVSTPGTDKSCAAHRQVGDFELAIGA